MTALSLGRGALVTGTIAAAALLLLPGAAAAHGELQEDRSYLKRLLLAAGALVAAALLQPGCYAAVSPGVGVAVVGHVHGPDCGHYRVWYDGGWSYYVGESWTYYRPAARGWVVYRRAPPGLVKHETSAKVYRPAAPHGPKMVKGKSEGYGAKKARPVEKDKGGGKR